MKTYESIVKTKSDSNLYNWLESGRTSILDFGYRFVELKSNIKRRIRDSYLMAGESRGYENITLSAVEGQRGKKSF